MKTSSIIAAVLTFAVASCLSSSALRAQEAVPASHNVPGLMDLQSGRFTPVAGAPVVPEVTAAQITSGVIELTITINIASDFPRDTVISCGMAVDVTALNLIDGALGKWLETASGTARVHGSAATCTLIIPYSWVLPTPTQTEARTLTGRFSVTATDAANKAILRSTDQPFLSTMSIPSNDTTSKYYVSATI